MQSQRSRNHREAKRRHLIGAGVAIEHEVDDLRAAIKRELWTRGLLYSDVAARMGVTVDCIKRRLECTCALTMSAGMLQRIIDAAHITPKVARRLHLLGAREAGWKV